MKSSFLKVYVLGVIVVLSLGACGKKEEGAAPAGSPASPTADKGIGPIKSLTLGPVDAQKAAEGQKIFQTKCIACHQIDTKLVGPALKGVTERRSPEWILNQMLNTAEMLQKDPTSKELLTQYNNVPMVIPGGITEDEAKSVLEYLRQVDGAK